MQRNLVPGIFWNQQAEVHSVSRSRWNQPHIYDRPRCPRVALVDGIAMRVDLQRTIKVRPLLDGAVAVILDHAAPENSLALIVRALQFEPGVVGVYRAAREEVPDFLGAHHHVHAHGIAPPEGGLYTVQRCRDGSDLSTGLNRDFAFGLFAYGEGGGKF